MEFDDFADTSSFDRENNKYLLNDMRCIIVGKSGSGKTSLMFNLILKWLDFDVLYIYGKSCYQPMYQKLKICMDGKCSSELTASILKYCKGVGDDLIADLVKQSGVKDNDQRSHKSGARKLVFLDELPPPEEFDKNKKNLIVFDDVMLGKQDAIEPFFTRGRHNNINMFYITQNYIEVPNHTIRENANFIIAFRQNEQNMRNLLRDHGSGLTWKEFQNFCHGCWAKDHEFMSIVPDSKYKFRCGFDSVYCTT